MTKKQKNELVRLLVTAALLLAVWVLTRFFVTLPWYVTLLFYLAPYLLTGGHVLETAVKNILRGQVFDENFLMALASLGAFCLGDYPEAVFVMLFYGVGEWFEGIAVGKSRSSIAELMNIRPDSANWEQEDGVHVVPPEEIPAGSIILVKPGEKIPLDGVVEEGSTMVNTVALTGEAMPRKAEVGDTVVSGCINAGGVIRVRTTKPFGESTVARILELVENAADSKSKSEAFITRFARVYTPIVVGCAVLVAVLAPLISFLSVGQWFWTDWLRRALTFLVVSCPCALVISVPLTFFGGIGGASRKGVLVKGTNYLEELQKCSVVVFDKTGTLTEGSFRVTAVHPEVISEEELLEQAALAETYSDHPISVSLRKAWEGDPSGSVLENAREIAGEGILVTVNGREVAVGNDRLMERAGAQWHPCHQAGTLVHVAVDGVYAGHIVISDLLKPDAKAAIEELHAEGVEKTVLLSGDRRETVERIGAELGMDEVFAELLPGDKVEKLEALLQEQHTGLVAFVGDGINDAPVLARADVGVAMGALGSDAAIEAADVVLMDDKPSRLAEAIRISRFTSRIAKENIIFALAIKLVVMLLSLTDVTGMALATFADVGVLILCVLNAMRTLKK